MRILVCTWINQTPTRAHRNSGQRPLLPKPRAHKTDHKTPRPWHQVRPAVRLQILDSATRKVQHLRLADLGEVGACPLDLWSSIKKITPFRPATPRFTHAPLWMETGQRAYLRARPHCREPALPFSTCKPLLLLRRNEISLREPPSTAGPAQPNRPRDTSCTPWHHRVGQLHRGG